MASSEKKADPVDWVTAVATWTPELALQALLLRLDGDLKIWKESAGGQASSARTYAHGDRHFFSRRISPYSNDELWACLEMIYNNDTFKYEINVTTSNASNESKVVVPTVNADGDQKLKIGGVERELWEASRFILEPILFSKTTH